MWQFRASATGAASPCVTVLSRRTSAHFRAGVFLLSAIVRLLHLPPWHTRIIRTVFLLQHHTELEVFKNTSRFGAWHIWRLAYANPDRATRVDRLSQTAGTHSSKPTNLHLMQNQEIFSHVTFLQRSRLFCLRSQMCDPTWEVLQII